jgi:hypothetical protein
MSATGQTPQASPGPSQRRPRGFAALHCWACSHDPKEKETSYKYPGPWRSHFQIEHLWLYCDAVHGGYRCCNEAFANEAVLMHHIWVDHMGGKRTVTRP